MVSTGTYARDFSKDNRKQPQEPITQYLRIHGHQTDLSIGKQQSFENIDVLSNKESE